MCEECGCDEQVKKVVINKSLTEVNDAIATQICDFIKEKEILCINVLGSPGSGKTSVIENISKFINPEEIIVIQGDLESDIDKKRIEKKNIDSYQINTHSGCHLNASMINKALLDINLLGKKYLIIENVGNLVCPAGVKIGQHMDIVVSSTTEGSDKPKKYPLIFMAARIVILSKYDLSKIVKFDEEHYTKDIKKINSKVKIFKTSVKNPNSFKELADFIEHHRKHLLGHEHKH